MASDFIGFGAGVVGFALLSPYLAPLDLLTHFGSALLLALLVVCSGWLNLGADGVALRKRVSEARRYFQAQLRTSDPKLDDDWYPYLVALGLAPEVQSWLAAFGEEPRRKERPERRPPGEYPSPEAAEPPRWTGGGGQFGGAGASGSWGSAVAGLTFGVSTSPSSSSSSSTSSSRASGRSGSGSTHGESRSGGGGGGGW